MLQEKDNRWENPLKHFTNAETCSDGKLGSIFRVPYWKMKGYVDTKWNRFVRIFSWPFYSVWVHPLVAISAAFFLCSAAFFFLCGAIRILLNHF